MPRYNNPYRQNRMSLNTADFQPAVFTPIEFTPVEQDYSILERSLARQEARQKEAQQQATAIDAALADVEKNLYNTPEMNQWFSDYKSNVKQQINDAAAVGDYASAINIATQQAGKIASDSAIIGRLEASKNYNAWLDELHKKREAGKINKDTEEYYKKQNPFIYEDAFDANGNIVKGNTYEDLNTPVDDIKLDQFIGLAFKYCTPRKPESGNYQKTKADGTSEKKTTEYVSEQAILHNLNEIFALQDDARAALWQRYIVQKDKYNELKAYVLQNPEDADAKKQLEMQRKVLAKGQGNVDFEHFVARTLGQTAISQNLAYRYVTIAEDLETTESKHKNARAGELAAESTIPENPQVEGGKSQETNDEPKPIKAPR